MKEDDSSWPPPDRVGRQELEVILGDQHISFTTTKLGSLMQVQQSKDPEGLRAFYYLVQVRRRLCPPPFRPGFCAVRPGLIHFRLLARHSPSGGRHYCTGLRTLLGCSALSVACGVPCQARCLLAAR